MLREHLDKTPDPEATLAAAAPPRSARRSALTPGGHRPGGALSELRGFGGRDGDLARRRRRLPRRRGVGRRSSVTDGGRTDDAEAGLRGLHVPAAAPRQGARPDRPARLRRRRHRPVRRPVAPLAFARLRGREGLGPRAGDASSATAGSSWPTSSSRPPRTSTRSPPTIPTPTRRGKARDWFAEAVEFAVGGRRPARLRAAGRRLRGRARSRHRSVAAATSWPGGARRPAAAGVTFSVEAHVGSIAPTPAGRGRARPVGARA